MSERRRCLECDYILLAEGPCPNCGRDAPTAIARDDPSVAEEFQRRRRLFLPIEGTCSMVAVAGFVGLFAIGRMAPELVHRPIAFVLMGMTGAALLVMTVTAWLVYRCPRCRALVVRRRRGVTISVHIGRSHDNARLDLDPSECWRCHARLR